MARKRYISLFEPFRRKARESQIREMDPLACAAPQTVAQMDAGRMIWFGDEGIVQRGVTQAEMYQRPVPRHQGMRVFRESADGSLQEVGWTSIQPPLAMRYGVDVASVARQPVPPADAPPTVGATVTQHHYQTRLLAVPEGGMERAVVLAEGDDPTILPGWLPAGDRYAESDRMAQRTETLMRSVGIAHPESLILSREERHQQIDQLVTADIQLRMAEQAEREIYAQFGNVTGLAAQEAIGTLTLARLTEHITPDMQAVMAAHARARAAMEQLHQMERQYRAPMGTFHGIPIVADPRLEPGAWQDMDNHMADALRYAVMGMDFVSRRPRIDPETAAASRTRARGLLKSLLTPTQWAEFEARGAVTERIDGCEFKLTPGGMILAKKPRLAGRHVSERWCVAPDPYADGNTYMPDEDKLIGQLLHLRAGPDQLRQKANIFPGPPLS